MKKQLCLSCLLLFMGTWTSFSQTLTARDIIERSRNYYNSLSTFSVHQSLWVKSSIAEDTNRVDSKCYIDRDKKQFLSLWVNNSGVFVDDDDLYAVYMTEGEYIKDKQKDKKFNIYSTRYSHYPFVDFENFLRRSFLDKMVVIEKDSVFILMGLVYRLDIRKTDYSIAGIIRKEYDQKFKGLYYEETRFQPIITSDTIINSLLTEVSDIISSADNIRTIEKRTAPAKFDRSLLSAADMKVLNGALPNTAGKLIFLDFFYQSCLPCLKSHPYMNDFFENAGPGIYVAGVADQLNDTLNMDNYINRHGIRYPIIMGEVALKISRYLTIKGYPSFVMIDTQGNIVEFRRFLSTAFFKRMKKEYFSGNKP
jgi:hypothetical protein